MRQRPPAIKNAAWRLAYRLAFPCMMLVWRLRRRQYQGALVALWAGSEILLLRSSYRRAWNLPGGGVRAGETPEQAARRELLEETGVTAGVLHQTQTLTGTWHGRRERVTFFELRLPVAPQLQLDGREIIEARFVSVGELRQLALTRPVELYLSRQLQTSRPA